MWAAALPLIDKVVTKTRDWTVESVARDLIEGWTQLWCVDGWRALLITRIMDRPRNRILLIEWMAGEGMADWAEDTERVLQDYAKAHGCAYIEAITARKGFERWAKRIGGYAPLYQTYTKAV